MAWHLLRRGETNKTSIHRHTKQTISLLSNGVRLQLHEWLTKAAPAIREFTPTWWLFNCHLQTTMAHKYVIADPVEYEEQLWHTPDSGIIACHFYPYSRVSSDVPSSTPVMILFHGLTGSSKEPYIQTLVKQSKEETENLRTTRYKFRAVVIHGRGCANAPVVSPQLHAPSFTNDVRFCIDRLRRDLYPDSKFLLVGFSLGANVMINYVGEEGMKLRQWQEGELGRVVGAISLGNPFDIYICSHSLESTWFRRMVYARKIAMKLTQYFKRVAEAVAQHPDISVDEVLSSTTPREYDDRVTRRLFGYPTVNQYYRECGSCHKIIDIKIPTIFINSIDDPISVRAAIPVEECRANPHCVLVTTNAGGHIGWFTGSTPKYWFSDIVTQLADFLYDAEMAIPPTEGEAKVLTSDPHHLYERRKRSLGMSNFFHYFC